MDGVENHNLGAESADSSEKLSVSSGEGGSDAVEKARLAGKYPEELAEANDSNLASLKADLPEFNKITMGVKKLTPDIKAALKGQWWRAKGDNLHLYSRQGMDITKPEDGDFTVRITVMGGDSFGLTVQKEEDGHWSDYIEFAVEK